MKKILPITTEIPIKTYNNIAYPLSVIFSNFNKPEDWLFLNSFSLKYGTEVNDITLNLPYNMDWECLDKKIISPAGTTIDNIINELLDNRYVYIAVDEFFIPYRRNYQKQSFTHDILIYGFDDLEKEFYVIGYDKFKKYSCQKLQFSILEQAIASANTFLNDNSETYEYFGAGNNFSLKLKNISSDLKINFDILRELVKSYIKGTEFYSHSGYLCYSGIQIYTKLIDDENALLDNRNWNIIKEHTEFILRFISERFDSVSIDKGEYDELYSTICICLSLSLKFRFSQNEAATQRLKKLVGHVYQLSESIFKNLINDMNF